MTCLSKKLISYTSVHCNEIQKTDHSVNSIDLVVYGSYRINGNWLIIPLRIASLTNEVDRIKNIGLLLSIFHISFKSKASFLSQMISNCYHTLIYMIMYYFLAVRTKLLINTGTFLFYHASHSPANKGFLCIIVVGVI